MLSVRTDPPRSGPERGRLSAYPGHQRATGLGTCEGLPMADLLREPVDGKVGG